MKLMRSSARQVQCFCGIFGVVVGIFSASPIACFIFDSEKGIDVLGTDWCVLPFVLACGCVGIAVSYGISEQDVGTGKFRHSEWVSTLIAAISFGGLTTFVRVIYGRFQNSVFSFSTSYAAVVYLFIPLGAGLLVVLGKVVMKKVRDKED